MRVAEHVYSRLCIGDSRPLPVKSHRSAVENMLRMRNMLQDAPGEASRDARMLLLYAGVSVQRRIALGSEGEEQSDLSVTLVLLFVLQILCDGAVRTPTPEPTGASAMQVDDGSEGRGAMSPSLLQNPQPDGAGQHDASAVERAPLPARSEDHETIEHWRMCALSELLEPASGDWDALLRLSPDVVCRACIGHASRLSLREQTLAQMTELAHLFFRCSALAFQYSMLTAAGSLRKSQASFLTLSNADFLSEANPSLRDEKLVTIVDAAESEAGQQILRDLILSFALPRHVVGVRRTPLLGREANRLATEQHPKLLGAAHEAAMRGAEWSWAEDPEPLHKVAALLAGLCILLAGRGETGDLLRKKDAFAGRVMLPFLETEPPPPAEPRLGYVPHNDEWLVYTLSKSGKPVVQLRHMGLEGLSMAALLMAPGGRKTNASSKRPL